MIGSIIENYKIVSVLGEGGMGIVYKAMDLKLERYVALKILNTKEINQNQFIERFKREAKNQAKLNHPNIVPVYGFTDAGGLLGIAMECIEGDTLEKIIFHQKRIEAIDALLILRQVLTGVAYAHSKGFIHRDIKPSNIIINKENVVKIMDFGISKSIFEKGITKTGTKIGTVLYMSPEQIKAEEPTRQSDIYSIGITFYEMLVGKTPFDLGTEYEIMEAHLKKNPPRVSLNLDSIPPEIDKIVSKSLHKNMYQRYKYCEEFIEDIDNILNKYENVPAAKKEEKQESKPDKFHKAKISVIAFAGLVVVAVLMYIVFNLISNIWQNKNNSENIISSDTSSSLRNSSVSVKSTFERLNTGLSTSLNSVFFIDDYTGFACGDNGAFIKTIDAGTSWKQIVLPDNSTYFDIHFDKNGMGIIVGENGKILRTNDFGENWLAVNQSAIETFFDITFINSSLGFIVGDNGTILRTNNAGLSWEKINSSTMNLLYSIFFVDEQVGFAVGWNGTVLKSDNGGNSWKTMQPFTDKYLKGVYFENSEIGIICGAGGEIFRTEDGGESWTKFDSKVLSGLTSVNFINSKRGIITSNRGDILETADGGLNWNVTNTGSYPSLTNINVSSNKNIFISGINGIILKLKSF